MRWFLAILAVLMLTACGNYAAQCPQGQTLINEACCVDANSNKVCDGNEEQPTPKPPVVTPEPPVVVSPPPVVVNPPAEPQVVEQTPSVANLLKMVQNIKSYQYIEGENTYKVLENTVRIELKNFFRPDGDHTANVVYLDLKTRTASAYCEGDSNTKRVCDPTQRGPFTVSFDRYYEKLPVVWLEELSNTAVVKITPNAQTIGSMKADRWDLKQEGKDYSLWVLQKYGMPVRVIVTIYGSAQEYNYKEMSVNTVRSEEIVPHPDVRV